jgi:thymidylate synthase
LIPHEFVHNLGNAHIYKEHVEPVLKQLENTPFDFPEMNIKTKRERIEDYTLDDFEIINYKSHGNIAMVMRV